MVTLKIFTKISMFNGDRLYISAIYNLLKTKKMYDFFVKFLSKKRKKEQFLLVPLLNIGFSSILSPSGGGSEQGSLEEENPLFHSKVLSYHL